MNLQDAVIIKDFLISNSLAYTTKQILTQINAWCNWSLRSKLIKSNPFNNMAGEIQLAKNSTDSLDIDPFSKEERDIIIEAFRTHPKYKCYAPFVEFLFLTGCRTSEAIGLKWKHINSDCSKITFCEAVVNTPRGKVRKGLKNQDKRIFPCNNQLQSFSLSIKPSDLDVEKPVFTSIKGNEVNVCTFNALCWHGSKHEKKHSSLFLILIHPKAHR